MFHLREPYTPPMLSIVGRKPVRVGGVVTMTNSDVLALSSEIAALGKRIDALPYVETADDDSGALATDFILFKGGFGWEGWLRDIEYEPEEGWHNPDCEGITCPSRTANWSATEEAKFRSFQKKRVDLGVRYSKLKDAIGEEYRRGSNDGDSAGKSVGVKDATDQLERNPKQSDAHVPSDASDQYRKGFAAAFEYAYAVAYDDVERKSAKPKETTKPGESKKKTKPSGSEEWIAGLGETEIAIAALAFVAVIGVGVVAFRLLV